MAGGGFGLTADALEFGEVLFIAGDGAVDAVFVEGEGGEVGGFAAEGLGLGDGGLDFGGVGRVVVGMFVVADTDGVEFDGAGAVEAPVVLGDGDGELGFFGAFGLEGGEHAGFEGLVCAAVVVGEDEELAGEAVAGGVEAGAGFAGFGAGARGVLGVVAIGLELDVGDVVHFGFLDSGVAGVFVKIWPGWVYVVDFVGEIFFGLTSPGRIGIASIVNILGILITWPT